MNPIDEERVAIIMEGCGLSERAATKLYYEQVEADSKSIPLQSRIQKLQQHQLEQKTQRYGAQKYLD